MSEHVHSLGGQKGVCSSVPMAEYSHLGICRVVQIVPGRMAITEMPTHPEK